MLRQGRNTGDPAPPDRATNIPVTFIKPKEMPPVNKDKFVIYQLFTRLFGNRNTTNKVYGTLEENGCGKFNDIDDTALAALKDFGVTHLWYTGVLEHATLSDYSQFGINPDHPLIVKGIAGSPYAVKDYYDVDPDLAVDVPNRM